MDVVGLLNIGWGNQLFIIMIETSLMALVMVVLSFIEMCKLKDRIDDDSPSYKQVNFDSVMNASSSDDLMDKK